MNKRRTYDIKLMMEIKRVELSKEAKTQLECIRIANEKIKSFRDEDLFKDGGFTDTAYNIRDSYRKKKKSLEV